MKRLWSRQPPSLYRLLRDGEELPDDTTDGVAWAPGARDGVLIYHWGGTPDEQEVLRLAEAIATLDPGTVRRAIGDARVVSLVDTLLGGVRDGGLDAEGIYRLGYELATGSQEREAVKLGIALLGLFDAEHHRDELMTLGGHDDFTLFALVALADPGDLRELAERVHGWGRIHLVERLAESPDPEIREWIVRHGFRNAVMTAYLAGTAAAAGDLAGLLDGTPDDELLEAAGEILEALAEEGGPVEGMSGYEDGELAAERYLTHLATRPDLLPGHAGRVRALRDYAAGHWPALLPRCDQLLA